MFGVYNIWDFSQKIEPFQPKLSDRSHFLVLGLLKRVKRLKNGSKNLIFKNWLDTRPKMETHDPNVYPTIMGVFREVFGLCS